MPIDMIGGTSMGAVIAAQHALGWDWQTMAQVNRDEWPRCEPQKNYTLAIGRDQFRASVWTKCWQECSVTPNDRESAHRIFLRVDQPDPR